MFISPTSTVQLFCVVFTHLLEVFKNDKYRNDLSSFFPSPLSSARRCESKDSRRGRARRGYTQCAHITARCFVLDRSSGPPVFLELEAFLSSGVSKEKKNKRKGKEKKKNERKKKRQSVRENINPPDIAAIHRGEVSSRRYVERSCVVFIRIWTERA